MEIGPYLSVAPEAGVWVGVVGLVDGLLPELVLAACSGKGKEDC